MTLLDLEFRVLCFNPSRSVSSTIAGTAFERPEMIVIPSMAKEWLAASLASNLDWAGDVLAHLAKLVC
jgi:hypothetical protein